RAMMLALMGFDLREALPRVTVPALVLAGSRDTNAPAPMMARMAEKIPGAAYVCLEGAGHLAPLERPGEFNEAVAAFLASVPESSRAERSGDPGPTLPRRRRGSG
ncbi:MAG: alpha/beta fold hydrolase, partial [Microvirga sp.]